MQSISEVKTVPEGYHSVNPFLIVGDSIIMMSDATPKYGATASHLYVYLENVDLTFKRALEAGARSVQEPADEFYGDRTAGVKDPTGNYWWIAQHVEDVPPEVLERRIKARSQPMTV